MIKFLKTKIFLISSTVTAWLLGSVGIASAGILTKPFEVIIEILMYMVIFGGVSYAALGVSQGILGWVASPDFIKLSFTGSDNTLVTAGWTVIRDFTNLLFILVMLVIGLATALRYKDYQVQKTLPMLILVALLINFTPVICGVIIDASNILMNFFLSAGTEGYGDFINFTGTAMDILTGAFKGIITNWRTLVNGVFVFQILFFIIFNILCAFVLLIFSALMLMRHIALWILVIFAPLAFFCLILPGTKGIFKKWWSNFLQWCFVGVGGAFFLYLTQVLLSNMDFVAGPPNLGPEGNYSTLAGLMLRSVPLILLAAGVFVTMSTSAMGANVVTGLAKKIQGKATGAAGKFIGGKISNAGRWAGSKIPRGVNAAMGRLSMYKPKMGFDENGNKKEGVGNWAKRGLGSLVSSPGHAIGTSWQGITQGKLGEKQDMKMSEFAKKKAMERTEQENTQAFSKALTPAERLGIIQAMTEKKQLKDAKKNSLVFSQKKVEEAYKLSLKGGSNTKKAREAMERSFSDNVNMMTAFANARYQVNPARDVKDPRTGEIKREGNYASGLSQDDLRKGYTSLTEKVVAESRGEDLDALAVNKKELARILAKFGDGSQLARASEKHGPEFTDELQGIINEEFKDVKDDNDKDGINKALANGNVSIKTARFLASNAAQGLGLNSIIGLSKTESINEAARALPPKKPIEVEPLPSSIKIRSKEDKKKSKETENKNKEKRKNIFSQYYDEPE